MKTINLKTLPLFIAVAISAVLLCCTRTDADLSNQRAKPIDVGNHLTIPQSKLFFEKITSQRHATTKSAAEHLNRLVIGTFTPDWDNAVASNNGIIGSVDVPIESQMKYIAVRYHYEANNTFTTTRIPLYQKLIFVKNDTLNTIFPYLLSLIPDKDFDISHRGEDIAGNFINLGDKRGFSGLAIYTTPYTGYLIRASRFANGNYVDGAFVLDSRHSFDENARKAESFLADIKIMRLSGIATKGNDDTVDGGQLDEVVVIAGRPQKDDDKEVDQEKDDVNEEDRGNTDPGGGGGGGSDSSSGDGNDSEINPEEEKEEFYTITVGEPVNGTVNGGGKYAVGSTAVLRATANTGYIFAGWSGDYSGLDNPARITVDSDKTIYAKFYEESSVCGKLVKNLESLTYMMRCRAKIGGGSGLTEYGYIKTATTVEELEGRDNAIAIRDLPNTLELAHTHIDVIHPSIADLGSIYRRYYKGCISDIENFKYIIVSPVYFVIFKIEDTDRMDVLIRDSLIIQKVFTDDNKYRYEFSKTIAREYSHYIPIDANSIEGHFSNFMSFFEYLNPGLSVSVYKTNVASGEMIYKQIRNREDFNNLINRTGICSN